MDLDRFHFPPAFRDVVALAIRIDLIDAFDFAAIVANHEGRLFATVSDIVEIAYVNRHSDFEKYRAVCKAADKFGAAHKDLANAEIDERHKAEAAALAAL